MSKKDKDLKISQEIIDFIERNPDRVIELATNNSKTRQIACDHTKKDGQINLKQLQGTTYGKDGEIITYRKGDCKCKHCHTQFNVRRISEQKLKEAAEIMHDAINQIKVFNHSKKGHRDPELVTHLGRTDLDTMKIVMVYSKMFLEKGKHKKKNKKNKKKGAGYVILKDGQY